MFGTRIRLPFQAQLLICQIGGIVLSGYAVNCLSMDLRNGTEVLSICDWIVAALLPALCGVYGTIECVRYGTVLADKRAGIDQWTLTRSTWDMLARGLPKTMPGSNAEDATTFFADDERIGDLRNFRLQAKKIGHDEERDFVALNPGTMLLLPLAALMIAIAIRVLWSYKVV